MQRNRRENRIGRKRFCIDLKEEWKVTKVKMENKTTLHKTPPKYQSPSHPSSNYNCQRGKWKIKSMLRPQMTLYEKVLSIITCKKELMLVLSKSSRHYLKMDQRAWSLSEAKIKVLRDVTNHLLSYKKLMVAKMWCPSFWQYPVTQTKFKR